MNSENAKKLISDTFESNFSKYKFVYFVKNLLGTFDDGTYSNANGQVHEIYKDHIKTYERLGTYTDQQSRKVDILIVYLQKESNLERARTSQRNFIAQYLRSQGEKDAGLIAFISPNMDEWRFSFVKMSYSYDKSDKGTVKLTQQFTPSKRYSFLVGPHENSHTAKSQMLEMLMDDQISPSLEAIEELFSVEKVTKEFFERYKELYFRLYEEFSKNKEFLHKVIEENKVDVSDFVKKLMGQIVFLYFLQKKGWLGVKQGEKWGNGDKKFLRNLLNKQYREYDNFFNDILEVLFYDTLNRRDRENNSVMNDQSYSPYFKCRIPYLNGGLFTPVYDWKNTKIYIDNNKFKEIFDVFDTFNFTVYESDPIEKEVAVDPEMLGKVFENLLEIRDRKSKGTYYTPREIVHYMCQESLINYLIGNSNIPETRIRSLINVKDQEIAENEKQKQIIENNQDLKNIALKVNELLKKVKICDPAVGSGAFPMGLLKEISTTRLFLNSYFVKEKNKIGNLLTEYDIKKETLENSIYGVDIDPGAVEIARLRFWLSLVVEHEIEDIEPLPNLDYKIMQGNSLIELLSPQLLAKTIDDERNKLIDTLSLAKTIYFNLSDIKEKNKKREEINFIIRQIINYDNIKKKETIWNRIKDIRNQLGLFPNPKQEEQYTIGDFTSKDIVKERRELDKIDNMSNEQHFEWHLNFNEVFENGGFDIIIANPPYIKEYVNRDAFNGLRNSPYYQGKMDLWYLFACRGIDLIKKDTGILTYIAQNNWTTSFGASKMRNKVIKDTQILSLIDFDDFKVFEAGIQTMVMIFKKDESNLNYQFDYRKLNGNNYIEDDLLDILFKNVNSKIEYFTPEIIRERLIDKKLNFNNTKVEIILNKLTSHANFTLTEKEVAQGIVYPQDRLNKKNQKILGTDYKVGMGMFVLSQDEKDNIGLTELESTLIKPSYTTKELNKWYGEPKNREWVIYTNSRFKDSKEIIKYPNLKKHLDQFKKVITSDNKPYGLHRARDEDFFKGEKIIVARKCIVPTFTFVDFDSYVSATFYVIKTKRINLKYLLALFNSSLFAFWLKHRGKMQGSNFQIDKEPILELPIFTASIKDQTEIIDNIEQIIKFVQSENYLFDIIQQKKVKYLEAQTNKLIYKLYEIPQNEIDIIEKDININ